MNKIWLGIAGIVVAFVIVGAITVIATGIGINNQCVTFEEAIKKQYKQNQNNYDKMFKTILETAQVPALYTEDMKKIYEAAIGGRYGKNGSKAMFQFIKEHNPTIDSKLYQQIQQVIEGGRLDFEANQKSLLDKKQAYETYIGVFPNTLFAGFLGFPKIDLAKFDIVTSDRTEKTFETKKDEVIKIKQ